eukprot:g23330.t1
MDSIRRKKLPKYVLHIKSNLATYRPITLLSTISKMMEGVINSAIKQHVFSNNLLSDAQFGFHQGHSAPDLIGSSIDQRAEFQ